MTIELTLTDVPQNRENLIIHNVIAIAPRLVHHRNKGVIKFSGIAHKDEIYEIMDFIRDYHPGDHHLHTKN